MILLGQHTASETSTYLADEEIEGVNSPDSYELRWRMMTEGLKAAQSGENPRIVEKRLHSLYKP